MDSLRLLLIEIKFIDTHDIFIILLSAKNSVIKPDNKMITGHQQTRILWSKLDNQNKTAHKIQTKLFRI